MNTAERSGIKKRAKRAGLPYTTYMREASLGRKIVGPDQREAIWINIQMSNALGQINEDDLSGNALEVWRTMRGLIVKMNECLHRKES